MIFLKLFLTFFKVGLVSFGGGYGMIALLEEEVLKNEWLTESEFLNFIAVCESTPGSMAVNMATFIGSSQGGILGSLVSTVGVVLPAFIIILFIASILRNILQYGVVGAVMDTLQPVIASLITVTGLTFFTGEIFGVKTIYDTFSFNYKGLIILLFLLVISFSYKKIKKKSFSPICLILVSAILGIVTNLLGI